MVSMQASEDMVYSMESESRAYFLAQRLGKPASKSMCLGMAEITKHDHG